MTKTLEQIYAARVYERVVAYGAAHPKDSPERKQYGSMAHKLPILVRSAGLTQALAFVESRGKDPQRDLLEDLAWVVEEKNRSNLLEQSRASELQAYVYLTRRTMLAMKWFKRFAQSVLEIEPTDEGDGGG